MYIYIYIYIYIYVCMYVCVYVHIYTHTYILMIRTYIHTYICIRQHTPAYANRSQRTRIGTACACVSLCASIRCIRNMSVWLCKSERASEQERERDREGERERESLVQMNMHMTTAMYSRQNAISLSLALIRSEQVCGQRRVFRFRV